MLTFPHKCGFDGTIHEDLTSLYAHLKRFRVARAKYFATYYPRVDKLTGQPIPFKDLDQYLTQDFLSKVTLRKWLGKCPEEGLAWSKAWLARRREEKGLVYAPSQTELRTLQCPSMPYYEAVAKEEGGYYGITRALGYKDRYALGAPPTFTPLPSDSTIVCDTREQTPITLAHHTVTDTLGVGDYALAAPHDQGIRIERKSLSDFCGTLSSRKVERKAKGKRGAKSTTPSEDSNLQRFERELIRAQEQGLYVVMMVEANITDAQRFDYLPQTQWVKASPAHVFHNLRDLLTRYPLTFQCCFVDGRVEMARVMLRVFQLGAAVRTLDLQYHLEEGLL